MLLFIDVAILSSRAYWNSSSAIKIKNRLLIEVKLKTKSSDVYNAQS